MGEYPLVIDISSDDDFGFDGCDVYDDTNWIHDLIDNMDGHESISCNEGLVADDDDDVVVIEVVSPQPKKARLHPEVDKSVLNNIDENDDCVILDGDPDKPNSLDQDPGQSQGQDNNFVGEPEDLVIVGEKGQVACRDYPHPRHLCAKFPFSTTLHTDYCIKCHCFVCESPAPCDHWGSGISTVDHCHAFNKHEFWNSERKRIKEAKATLSHASWADKVQGFTNQVQAPAVSLAQSSSPTLRPLSSFGLSNTISQARSQRPKRFYARNHRYHPHLVSQNTPKSHECLRRGTRMNLQSAASSPVLDRQQNPKTPFVVDNKSGDCSYNNVNQAEINPTRSSLAYSYIDLESVVSMGPCLDQVEPQALAPLYSQHSATDCTAAMPLYSACNAAAFHTPTPTIQEHLTENSQLQGAVHSHELLPATQNYPLPYDSAHIAGSLNLEFDGIFENQTSGSTDDQGGYPSLKIDYPSTMSAPLETCLPCFDFEASWSQFVQS